MWTPVAKHEWTSGGELPIRFLFVTDWPKRRIGIKKFLVEEIPEAFHKFRHGKEKYFVYRLEKSHIDHWKALEMIERETGIDRWKIGYSGIKDRNDITIQYITLPEKINNIHLRNLKLEFVGYSPRKFKPGMLRTNRFEIWLRGLDYCPWKERIPNYYGLQRFGKRLDNHIKALEMVRKGLTKARLEQRLILHSIQSWIFNESLSRMIESGKVPERIPLLSRDMGKQGKVVEEIAEELGIEAWEERRIERESYIEPEIECKKAGKIMILRFELPKSSYATTVLQEISKKGIRK